METVGITSVHNARQIGGYYIGNKQIKKDLLIRTARLSSLSTEDSLLLADKYRVQCIYDSHIAHIKTQTENQKTSPREIP